jgi:hypothetical protein
LHVSRGSPNRDRFDRKDLDRLFVEHDGLADDPFSRDAQLLDGSGARSPDRRRELIAGVEVRVEKAGR